MELDSKRNETEKLLLWLEQLFFGYKSEVTMINGDKG
jgi:hypothetical protein